MKSEAAHVGELFRCGAAPLFTQVASAFAACAAVALGSAAVGAEYLASNASQITAALAVAGPGDVVVMADGVWTNQSITFADNGTSTSPVTLRAQTPGQVILNGASKLSINGNWLVVDGLRFEAGALTGGSIINLSGNNLRLTNTAIIDYNPPAITTEVDWVTVNGQDNRVDHNYFKNHNSIGQTLEVRHTAGVPNRARIDGNYFADRPAGNGNGWETIRIGLSGVATSNSFSVVENNLFERVDGENEAISNKSSNNIYRYNTFRDMRATLTLRHGNDSTVEGNFFLGENQEGSGGVRVIGQRHKIINNYFSGVDDNGGGAIAINRGQIDAEATGYQSVRDVVIAHNTIVNTLGAMVRFDAGASDRPLLAENVTVANNVFRSNGPAIFREPRDQAGRGKVTTRSAAVWVRRQAPRES
jgi:poly(beta-D-mannuronate) lyase